MHFILNKILENETWALELVFRVNFYEEYRSELYEDLVYIEKRFSKKIFKTFNLFIVIIIMQYLLKAFKNICERENIHNF